MSTATGPGVLLEQKYRLLRLLGEGGMGAVYEAEHVLIKRRVAVKVLHQTEAQDAESLARFRAEAQAAARIRHANIVEVMDFGVCPDGRPFIVMEYLNGEALSGRLDTRGRLSERETVELGDQILSGLAVAHRSGIVHRDLKPENIFINRTDDHRETVKILDFGISKLVAGTDLGERLDTLKGRPVTERGVVLGTPGYMAPEALFGGAVDKRADLFAVGVLLFEMLTGRRPFVGKNAREIMVATSSKPVPRPRDLRGEISGAMERLVLTALAREPDDRFATADEMLAQLTAAAVGRVPADARPCRTETAPGDGPSRGRIHRGEVGSEFDLSDLAPQKKIVSSASGDEPIPLEQVAAPPRMNWPPPERGTGPAARANRGTGGRPAPQRPARRRFIVPFSLWSVVIVVGVAAAFYYFFFHQAPVIVAPRHSDRAARDDSSRGPVPGGGPQPTPQPRQVRIWIDSTPEEVTVTWNGSIIDGRPLVVPRAERPVQVVFSAPGYVDETLRVTPIEELTLTVKLKKRGAKPRPSRP